MFKERPLISRYTVTFDENLIFEYIKGIACFDEQKL